MDKFEVSNTTVVDILQNPVYGSTWSPTITSPIVPGEVQFSNITINSAYFTQVNKIVYFALRVTAIVNAPAAEVVGHIYITPPVYHITTTNSVSGIVLAFPLLFGNLSRSGELIEVDLLNPGSIINNVPIMIEILGSYMIE